MQLWTHDNEEPVNEAKARSHRTLGGLGNVRLSGLGYVDKPSKCFSVMGGDALGVIRQRSQNSGFGWLHIVEADLCKRVPKGGLQVSLQGKKEPGR